MISMLQRIKERQRVLEQQEEKKEVSSKAETSLLGPSVDTEEPHQEEKKHDKTDALPDKTSSHHRKERKPKEKPGRRPPKVIYLNAATDVVSPLRLSRSLVKQGRKSQTTDGSHEHGQSGHHASREQRNGSPKKKITQKIRTEDAHAKTLEHEDASCCSSSVNPNDSVLNESWDLTSFLSGDASFTKRVATRQDGNQSLSSKCNVVSNRRGSVASSRRGSVASSRRGSVASSHRGSVCADESSVSSSILDELEVRSKGTIKCRPSYSEIKGHVTSEHESSKSLIRRYSIDNSNLRSALGGSEVEFPSCLKICEAKLNGPAKSKDQGLGVCYGIIDKYMTKTAGNASDHDMPVRRCQSYAMESASASEEESLSTCSSAISGESSKRISMTPSNLKQQLKDTYLKRPADRPPSLTLHDENDCFELPERSKSDISNMKSKTHSSMSPSCQSPIRTHSNGSDVSKGSLPILSPGLASPRKPLSNSDIFKRTSERKSRHHRESRSSKEKSRSRKSGEKSRRHDSRTRGKHRAEKKEEKNEPNHDQSIATLQQATTCSDDTYTEENVDYVPPSLRSNQPFSRRQSTGQVHSSATEGERSPQRRQSTGQNQNIYPDKDDEIRSYLEIELKVAKPSKLSKNDKTGDESSASSDKESMDKDKKKRKKPRVSKAA